jgi:hypothetical protein
MVAILVLEVFLGIPAQGASRELVRKTATAMQLRMEISWDQVQ